MELITERAPNLQRRLLALALALSLAGALLGAQTPSTADWRSEMLQIAAKYAEHTWSGTQANVYHGLDTSGVQVDTPDASYSEQGWKPGERFRGVPYAWGGFSSLEEFNQGLAAGSYAGHIPRDRRSRASASAVGVDCSGFVSRCWDLPVKQSTRSLGVLCYELESYDELEPGDAINRYDAHVMLFAGFEDEARTLARVFEAVTPCVLERVHRVEDLEAAGYVPLRYRPLDARWEEDAVDCSSPTLAAGPDAKREWRALGPRRDIAPDDLSPPYATSSAGEWTRFSRSSRSPGDGDPELDALTLGVAQASDRGITLHRNQGTPGHHGLDAFIDRERTTARIDTWVPLFLTAGVPPTSSEYFGVTVQDGVFRLGEHELQAQLVEAEFVLTYPGGTDGIPVVIRIEAVHSQVVPLSGLVRLDAHLEILADPDKPSIVDTRLELLALGRAEVAGAASPVDSEESNTR